jgi:hypothetical protein
MKVAVISSAMAEGARIAVEIEKVSGVEAWILVFKSRNMNPWMRLAREVYRFITTRSFFSAMRMAVRGRIRYFVKAIDDPASIAKIKTFNFDLGVHSLNVIYRRPVITAFGCGILNSHIGLLPGYRGRCVAEWSLLVGNPVGITVFFIDEGVDTGPEIILQEKLSVAQFDSIAPMKAFLFGEDARMYSKAIGAIRAGHSRLPNCLSEGRRYYPMSKLFLNVVEELLQSSVRA